MQGRSPHSTMSPGPPWGPHASPGAVWSRVWQPLLAACVSLSQGRSLWSESRVSTGQTGPACASTNLSVWFGSLSWPPSQRPFPWPERWSEPQNPTPRAQDPGNNQAPQWTYALWSQMPSYRKRATIWPWLPLAGVPLKPHPVTSVDREWKSERTPKKKKET